MSTQADGEGTMFEWGEQRIPFEEITINEVDDGYFTVQFPTSDESHVVTVEESESESPSLTCTCPDYRFRRAKLGDDCKHMNSVRKVLADGGRERSTNRQQSTEVDPMEAPVEEYADDEGIKLTITDPEIIDEIEGVFRRKREEIDSRRSEVEREVQDLVSELQDAEDELDALDERVAAYDSALRSLDSGAEERSG